MPAILVARLQEQTRGLLDAFDQPDRFLKLARDVFEYYSDHVYRAGQAFESQALLDSYHVPAPLIPTMTQFLMLRIAAEPDLALRIVDSLWADKKAETKLLAITILGKISVSYSREIMIRANRWIEDPIEYAILEKLSETGLQNLLDRQPEVYLDLMESWIGSDRFPAQRAGFHGLVLLLKQSDFDNLPRLFKLLQSRILTVNAEIGPELVMVLQTLGKKSAVETSQLFQQVLSLPGNAVSRSIVREASSVLPPDMQNQIKSLLRTSKRTGKET